jgi:hypothetical protein
LNAGNDIALLKEWENIVRAGAIDISLLWSEANLLLTKEDVYKHFTPPE